jgi:hypothetical protein
MKRVNAAYRALSQRPDARAGPPRRARARYSAAEARSSNLDSWGPRFLSTAAGKVALAVMVVLSSILAAVLLASALVFLLE